MNKVYCVEHQCLNINIFSGGNSISIYIYSNCVQRIVSCTMKSKNLLEKYVLNFTETVMISGTQAGGFVLFYDE